MTNSERYTREAQESESDFRALALHTKALREVRLERFEDGYKELLEDKKRIVVPFNGSKVVIDTQWKNAGLRWLHDNILK